MTHTHSAPAFTRFRWHFPVLCGMFFKLRGQYFGFSRLGQNLGTGPQTGRVSSTGVLAQARNFGTDN